MEDAELSANTCKVLTEQSWKCRKHNANIRFQSKSCTFWNLLVAAVSHNFHSEVSLKLSSWWVFADKSTSSIQTINYQTLPNQLRITHFFTFFPGSQRLLGGLCLTENGCRSPPCFIYLVIAKSRYLTSFWDCLTLKMIKINVWVFLTFKIL